jgi:hypothetical protein
VPLEVLVLEGSLEVQAGEEGPYAGNEELELGGDVVVLVLVDDWVSECSASS